LVRAFKGFDFVIQAASMKHVHLDHFCVKQRNPQFFYELRRSNNLEMINTNSQFFEGRASDFNYFFSRFTSGLKNKMHKSAEKIDF